MIYVDELQRDWQVMHRVHAAELCSRPTVMRRLRAGTWWRPTPWTVAARRENYDADFPLLTAAAHVWRDGGVSGPSLAYAFGLAPVPVIVEASVSRSRRLPDVPGFVWRRRSQIELRNLVLPSGRDLTVDVGPGSLVTAATGMTYEDVCWLLIRATQLEQRGAASPHLLDGFRAYLLVPPATDPGGWSEAARAVIGGCESAGEVYMWHLLESLNVPFMTQAQFAVPEGALVDSRRIRADFLLAGGTIIEVDSALHDHLKDVRRDWWNLSEGRRTIRVVGRDLIADPVAAQLHLATALTRLGIRIERRPLPSWLTAA